MEPSKDLRGKPKGLLRFKVVCMSVIAAIYVVNIVLIIIGAVLAYRKGRL